MFTDELTIDITACDINRTDEEIYNDYKNLSNDGQDRSLNDIINKCLVGNSKSDHFTNKFFDKEKKEEETVVFDSTQQYFKDINNVYERNGNNYDIEYCEENRDKLIEMNLKTVVSIAKKYQGLGLSLNELISAGNLGLVLAYDKFDPTRSRLKDNILSSVGELDCEFSYDELLDVVKDHLSYGDIKKKFQDKFKIGHRYKRKEVEKWINNNISNAKFNSIAVMWIRAYILIEIDNHSRIVKKPKSEIYKDKEKNGSYKKEQIIDIDAPVGNDTDTRLSDLLPIEDDTRSDLETGEAYDIYKNALNKLLDGVKVRDRSIFLKKYSLDIQIVLKEIC